MMNGLRTLISEHILINEDEWQHFQTLFTKRTFQKGEVISYAGEVMEKVYYLESGVARSVFTSDEGKEYVWHLYFNLPQSQKHNALMDDCVSYHEQSPSQLRFEALEDVVCYEVSWQTLEKLFESHMKWQKLGRLLVQQGYANAYKRTLSLMAMSASQRYVALLEAYPDIFSHVKAYEVAAYLGITPQSLSRLRQKLP